MCRDARRKRTVFFSTPEGPLLGPYRAPPGALKGSFAAALAAPSRHRPPIDSRPTVTSIGSTFVF
eukprot:9503704-Pyramimonas_sp.AAC.1